MAESPATRKPVIFAVDDDPQVLRAVDRDLRRRYAREYRVMRADSGEAALDALGKLKLRGDPVALFVVDQRMPRMTGVEFLERAIEMYPEAKRDLLTAYADTDAAIRAINEIGLDYYLQKPWDPPEEHLYPVLDDQLEEWLSGYRHGGDVVVEVADDGPRIPRELQGRVFEPFFTTKGAGEGTGLGLDVARRVVRAHGGEISFDSGPGGTRFAVRLPVGEQHRGEER